MDFVIRLFSWLLGYTVTTVCAVPERLPGRLGRV